VRFKPGHVSPSLTVILAEGFLSRLSFGIIGFALPLYAYRRFGLSLTETGLLLSMNLMIEQLLKPPMGWAADRFGLKRSLTLAIALRSLVALMLAFASAPWQVFAIRAVHGLSESLRDPSVSALIAENSRKGAVASSFAWYSTAKTAAGAIGKAAGGILLAMTAYNYSRVFIIAFILSVLPLYTVARYLREAGRRDESESESGSAAGRAVPANTPAAAGAEKRIAIMPLVLLGVFINTTAHMLQTLLPVLAVEYAGLGAAETGVIYAISVVVVLVAGPAFGWLSDNFSHRLVLLVRGAANTLSSVAYLLSPTFAGIAAGNAVDACGKAAFRPAWGALMAHVSNFDRRKRALTMGYLALGEGIGETIGPILGGFLWNTWGIATMLIVRIALAIAAEAYTVIVARPMERSAGSHFADGQ
jgi:MFS family permease